MFTVHGTKKFLDRVGQPDRTPSERPLRKALVETGQAAARAKDTYLAAQYAQIRSVADPNEPPSQSATPS